MANTFKKVYRKIANTGSSSDYSLVAEVGANGVTLERMTGATSAANGKMGLVPAPTSGNQNKFLRGDGTWVIPEDTTYGIATTSQPGLLQVLEGGTSNFLRADGTWATPTIANIESTSNIINESTAILTSGGVYSKLGLTSSENFVVGNTTYDTVKAAIDALNVKAMEGSTLKYSCCVTPRWSEGWASSGYEGLFTDVDHLPKMWVCFVADNIKNGAYQAPDRKYIIIGAGTNTNCYMSANYNGQNPDLRNTQFYNVANSSSITVTYNYSTFTIRTSFAPYGQHDATTLYFYYI